MLSRYGVNTPLGLSCFVCVSVIMGIDVYAKSDQTLPLLLSSCVHRRKYEPRLLMRNSLNCIRKIYVVVSLALSSSLAYPLAAHAQHFESINPLPASMWTPEERASFHRFIANERYWWLSIQMLSWEDCMISQGHNSHEVIRISSDQVKSVLGPYANMTFFSAVRKIGYHKNVIPLLGSDCLLPQNAEVQQLANRLAMDELNKTVQDFLRYVQQLKDENKKLEEDIALQKAIKLAPYCNYSTDILANTDKEHLYSLGPPLQRIMGYAAANALLNGIIERRYYRKNQCRPILKPMPPSIE
jgi:hypothetical protein